MAVGKTLPLCEKGDFPYGKRQFQLGGGGEDITQRTVCGQNWLLIWPPADKISRRLLIGQDCHLDQSEAYDVS